MFMPAADRHSATPQRSLQSRDVAPDWLLAGDPCNRIPGTARSPRRDRRARLKPVQARIARRGWGARLMAARRADGHWGRGFYQPKWISTHYTLLDLAGLCFPRTTLGPASVDLVFDAPRGRDGGIHYAKSLPCANVLHQRHDVVHAAWFKGADRRLFEIVDYLLERRMSDGGWNCDYWRGARPVPCTRR